MKDIVVPAVLAVVLLAFLYFTQIRPGASGELIVWGGLALAGVSIMLMVMSNPKRRR